MSEDTKKQTSYTEVTDSVVEGIQSLETKRQGHLVIVTNNVFEDGLLMKRVRWNTFGRSEALMKS